MTDFLIVFFCIFQIFRKIFCEMKKLSHINFYRNFVTWSGWSMTLIMFFCNRIFFYHRFSSIFQKRLDFHKRWLIFPRKYFQYVYYFKFWKQVRILRILSTSESVNLSLIESVICLFIICEKIFFTVKSVYFHWFISEKNIFHYQISQFSLK